MLQDRFDNLGLIYDADYEEGKAIVEQWRIGTWLFGFRAPTPPGIRW